MPTLFVSHGAPSMALEPNAATRFWQQVVKAMPRPRAVLAVSAHWDTARPTVSISAAPETIHDFYGFPEPLYRLRYEAPGAPDVACEAARLIDASGMGPVAKVERGLDHGAWVPLRYLYPEADIPVAQLAIQPRSGTRHHYAMGKALAPLAEQGVLILASGGMSHNLREWAMADPDAAPPSWLSEFTAWVRRALAAGDHEALIDYARRAPHPTRNHPSDEHFMPFFVALAAAGPAARAASGLHDVADRAIALDAFLLAEPADTTYRPSCSNAARHRYPAQAPETCETSRA